MKTNGVSFAVVREDPIIDEIIIKESGSPNALLIGSGGCTGLHLMTVMPELDLTLFDTNPAQLELISNKFSAINSRHENMLRSFNVGSDSNAELNGLGSFESLFRAFRKFINEFVIQENELLLLFQSDLHKSEILEKIVNNRYWRPAFDLFFSDSLLEAMFSSAATQNAPSGSYPTYFRNALENGLAKNNIKSNYFLHHLFLGFYIDQNGALPTYLTHDQSLRLPNLWLGDIYDIPNIQSYGVIGLSNIFDWMNILQVTQAASYLNDKMKPGSVIIVRQLNNDVDMSEAFGSGFFVDHSLGENLLRIDRSLFYSKINVIRKI